jgi:hypothetical protein
MNTLLILESAAQFNATHDYDIEAALRLSSLVVRHAHMVQLARKEQADPQLTLPIEFDEAS